MNICKEIIDQLPADGLNKLSSLIGSDSETTSYAISAAVPALMSGLAGLASREDGAKKLTNAIGQLGSVDMGDFARNLSGDANSLAQNGTSLLHGLFGDSVLSGLTNAISKYAGLGAGAAKGLLAFLAPMVLGKVANIWRGRGATPQALTSLFAEQRENIADCAPAGLALSDIPGWPAAKYAVRSAADTGRRAVAVGESSAPSIAKWAIPLALALLGAFLLWTFLKDRPNREATADRTKEASQEVTAMKPVAPATTAVPTVESASRELQELYTRAGEVMASISDAASAEAAEPQLEELSAKIDATRTLLRQLPASARTTVQKVADQQLVTFKDQAATTLETPELPADIKSLITQIIQKLSELFAPATS
jgi:hypothetical protein